MSPSNYRPYGDFSRGLYVSIETCSLLQPGWPGQQLSLSHDLIDLTPLSYSARAGTPTRTRNALWLHCRKKVLFHSSWPGSRCCSGPYTRRRARGTICLIRTQFVLYVGRTEQNQVAAAPGCVCINGFRPKAQRPCRSLIKRCTLCSHSAIYLFIYRA